MTSNTFRTRRSAGALDIAVAALAGLSVGFVAFAMPEEIFSGLVTATRLPEFVAAAQPPLGSTARLLAVGASALVTFGLVFSLLRALDRLPSGRRPSPVEREEEEAPRLRRADAHPDAPSRRPLLARDELGEPDAEPEPDIYRDQAPETPVAEASPLPAFLVAEPEPVAAPQAGPEEVMEHAPEPEAEIEPLELSEEAPASIDILTSRVPRQPGADDEESVSKLMRRLEGGLTRRRKASAVEAPSEPPPAQPEEERVGHRLRSAINDLNKMSAQGG